MNKLIKPLISLVNEIPAGKVISYGRLAQQLNILTDESASGWSVGRILSSMPTSERSQLPWQRVINKQGYISSLKLGAKGLEQIRLLREEGVQVDSKGYIDMKLYEWNWSSDDLFK